MWSRAVLSAAQRRLAEASFARTQDFFSTGGAALGGLHLGHRVSQDLDLFTVDGAVSRQGRRILAIRLAVRKDAGVEPATLAWILGQVHVNEVPFEVQPPVAAPDLQAWVDGLARDLAAPALPT